MRTLKLGDVIAPTYLLLCLLLGGASAAGILANALLQALAVVLLAYFALQLPAGRQLLGTRGFSWLVAATAALVLYQLIPLPGGLWPHLPGRDEIAGGYRLLGMPPPALSLSLDVDGTIASGLSLLPPLAMAVATIHASVRSRLLCFVALAAMAVLSTLVGALQLSGGPRSPSYFYAITNSNAAVGFFANSNHLATLFLIALPCIAALAARNQVSGHRRDAKAQRFALLGLGIFFCFGLLLNRSLAGLSLMLPVLFACWVLWRRGTQKSLPRWQIAVGAGVAALVLAFAFAGPLSTRFAEKTLSLKDPVTRRTTNTLTLRAAIDHLPFGTGPGTFVPVYKRYEKPETITATYVNHAHDEYAELALETGLPGIVLLIAWLIWYARRSRDIWAGEATAGSLARAGSVMIGIVLIHSLVDYPARTAAIASILGLAFGMLATPVARVGAASKNQTGARHAKA